MKPGDLLRIRGSRVLWSDDGDARIMGDERLADGELVVFVGRAKYMFIHAVAELKPERGEDAALDAVRDIIHVARNVKQIDDVLDNFYVS